MDNRLRMRVQTKVHAKKVLAAAAICLNRAKNAFCHSNPFISNEISKTGENWNPRGTHSKPVRTGRCATSKPAGLHRNRSPADGVKACDPVLARSGPRCTEPSWWTSEKWPPSKLNSIRSHRSSSSMLKDIVLVSPLEGHRLQMRYEGDVEGIVGVDSLISFRGVFAPLKDPAYFRRCRVIRNSARLNGRTVPIWIPMSFMVAWSRTVTNWRHTCHIATKTAGKGI